MEYATHNDHLEPFFITEEIEAEIEVARYVLVLLSHVSITNAWELFGP